MKKSRLLEIIHEEITFALSETTNVIITNKKGESDALPYNTPSDKMEVNKLKQDSNIASIKTTSGQKIKELATKYNLSEELINEMASIKQLKGELEKQGKEKELEAVMDAEKTTLDALKKDPNITSDGRLKGYVSAFKKELKNTHGINLQDLLTKTSVDAEGKFNDDIATNTIEKDAANQITGKEVGQRGRKPSEKPSEEPKTKKEKSKPTPKPSEEEESEEETDDSTYYKSEEEFETSEKEPSSKDVKAAEKEFGNVASDKLEKFNTGLKFIKKYKDDKKIIDAYLKKAKDEYKLPSNMIKDLKRAAGREVEA